MNLNIDIIEKTDESIINLKGEIDIYTAPQLKETLLLLSQEKGKRMIINLKHVNYMDSTGLGVFIGVLKSAQEHATVFKLINLNDRVLRLFTITGLDEIMDISPLDQGVEVKE